MLKVIRPKYTNRYTAVPLMAAQQLHVCTSDRILQRRLSMGSSNVGSACVNLKVDRGNKRAQFVRQPIPALGSVVRELGYLSDWCIRVQTGRPKVDWHEMHFMGNNKSSI